jgi:hypothetical protein
MAKRKEYQHPENTAELDDLVVRAQEADAKAREAENDHDRVRAEGLPETRAALAATCVFVAELNELTIEQVEGYFAGKTYTAFDRTGEKPDGIVNQPVPFGKPAKENRAVPAVKLGMPNRSKAVLSRSSSIIHHFLELDPPMPVAGFDEWLMKDHLKDGVSKGRGIAGAYAAYCAPDDKPQAGTATPVVISDDLKAKAFKNGKVLDAFPVAIPDEAKHGDLFAFVGRQDESGVITVVPLPLSGQLAKTCMEQVATEFSVNAKLRGWNAKPAYKVSDKVRVGVAEDHEAVEVEGQQ